MTNARPHQRSSYLNSQKANHPSPQRILRTGFPLITTVNLKYAESFQLTSTYGATAAHNFRTNSAFDPNQSGTGHQPLGFDQWSSFYNHYIVLRSSIRVTFTSAAANTSGLIVGVYISDDTTVSGDPYTLIEQGLTKYKILNATNTNSKPTTLSANYSTKSYYNVTNVNDNVGRLGAGINANPTETAIFHVFQAGLDPTVPTVTVGALVEIVYTVQFSEPKELATS